MTARRRAIDPDALDLAAIRGGSLRDAPVTVLGFARSGIALSRFLADAGALVTVYDGRPAEDLGPAIAALEHRPVRLALGPDVEPASTWADAVLVTTSPSINPDFPTTEPRLRVALAALVEARASGDPSAPAIVS
jgi:UDP-N-acetylmuramoylalanine-D-glutamate ligase